MSQLLMHEENTFLVAEIIEGTSGNDSLSGTGGDDVIRGLGGDDYLGGAAGSDLLVGGSGRDGLYGHAGNDRLNGGAGDDHLEGGEGSDTYLFGLGSGQDTIREGSTGGQDRIVLGAGIATDDVTVSAVGAHLVLTINSTGDKLTVEYHFAGESYAINHIEFADGTIWDEDDIIAKLQPTDGDDTLYGTAGDDVMNGLGGNDSLYGNAGDDILDGGAGNDYMNGGAGNDTYLFGLGSGQDSIGISAGETDRILLDAGIKADDVTVSIKTTGYGDPDSLMLSINGTTDSLLVYFYFSSDSREVDIEFADGTVWGWDDVIALFPPTEGDDKLFGSTRDDVIDALGGNDRLNGYRGDDTLRGGEGNDNLIGGAGNDFLEGSAGTDVLSGGSGDDILDGGVGNDRLYGHGGNDTYLFGIGSGQDTLYDRGGLEDRLVLGAGITAEDLILRSSEEDLYLSINGTTDKLTLDKFFKHQGEHEINHILFADGTVWDRADILAHISATEGADTLRGSAGNDVMFGLGGNDTIRSYGGDDLVSGDSGNDYIFGGGGKDILRGGAGNDELYGEGDDDTLNGGLGNDRLDGGMGDDIYRYDLGSGTDTISDNEGSNRIVLGAGMTTDNVILRSSGNALVLSFDGASGQLNVSNWFDNSDTIGGIEFADGTVWDRDDILAHLPGPTEGNDGLHGTGGDDVINGLGGNDDIHGHGGNDTLGGDAGNDTLNGDDGNDLLQGGSGDDWLYGDAGNDTLDGGAGNDVLQGGGGGDTYLFGIGGGLNVIYESSYESDRLVLGAGITTDDVIVSADSNRYALILTIEGTGERMYLDYQFNDYDFDGVDSIEFADGTIWNRNDMSHAIPVTAGDDIWYGTSRDDVIDGLGGNDRLYGREGSDTYLFGIGSGKDIIFDNDTSGSDRIVLDAGITADDVTLSTVDYFRVLSIKGTTDTLSIYRYGSYNGIDAIEFADGTVWDLTTMARLAAVGVNTHADAADMLG